MDVPRHPDLETFVREQVDAGHYRTSGEVLTEALFLLWGRDQARQPDRNRADQAARSRLSDRAA